LLFSFPLKYLLVYILFRAWRVVVENGLIKSWQVYADSKIPFDIMNDSDKNEVENQKP